MINRPVDEIALECLVGDLLDLWQENIRLLAVEHELLTPAALRALLQRHDDHHLPDKDTPNG